MSRKPIHIKEDDSLPFIINIFERTRISGAPVVNAEGDYVGVISKTDLSGNKLLEHLRDLEHTTARDFMCPEKPLSVSGKQSVDEAVNMMLKHSVHRIFVHDQNRKIVGVVSTFDILRLVDTMGTVPNRPAAPTQPAEKAAPPAPPKLVAAPEPAKAVPEPVEAPVTSTPRAAAPEGEKTEKEKELERRIFNLISMKQEQIAGKI